MGEIPDFCNCYSKMLEGDNVEYFRYQNIVEKDIFGGKPIGYRMVILQFCTDFIKIITICKSDFMI